MSHRELINWALETQPLRWEPGYHYAYSNFGYCLLGRMIEKITKQKYDQYIVSAVLGPSGISDMQIAGNTLEERAANEVKYYSQVAGQDPYDLNIASALTQTEDTGIGASFSKIALAEVVHVKGRQSLLWALM
jgi:CubicO group peptidase (beta-lactamase class C family)